MQPCSAPQKQDTAVQSPAAASDLSCILTLRQRNPLPNWGSQTHDCRDYAVLLGTVQPAVGEQGLSAHLDTDKPLQQQSSGQWRPAACWHASSPGCLLVASDKRVLTDKGLLRCSLISNRRVRYRCRLSQGKASWSRHTNLVRSDWEMAEQLPWCPLNVRSCCKVSSYLLSICADHPALAGRAGKEPDGPSSNVI